MPGLQSDINIAKIRNKVVCIRLLAAYKEGSGLHSEASVRVFLPFFSLFKNAKRSKFLSLFAAVGWVLTVVHDDLSQEGSRTSITPACLVSSCP